MPRYVYEVTRGVKLGPSRMVRHACDVRRCIAPKHLISGTHADNMADRNRRERQARGEGHGRATLTEDDIRGILRMRMQGALYKEIGLEFGMDPGWVCKIVRRKQWAHVEL